MAITDVNDGESITDTIYQTIKDTVENLTTGHDHDGVNSKLGPVKIVYQAAWTGTLGDGNAQTIVIKAFSAAAFASTDRLRITVHAYNPSNSDTQLKVTGLATDTTISIVPSPVSQNIGFSVVHVWQGSPNDLLTYSTLCTETNSVITSVVTSNADTNTANWLAQAWTLNIYLTAVTIGSTPTGWICVERIPQVT